MNKKELVKELTCGVSTLIPWAEILISEFEEVTYQNGKAGGISECIAEIQRIGKTNTSIKTCNLFNYIIRHLEQLKEQKNE